jgi:hypothetical protein
MNEILVILHLLGFGAAAASGIGNAVVSAKMAASPGDAPVLGRIPPVMARIGQIGVAMLWATGLTLVWSKYGGPENLPLTFIFKLAGAITLTGLVIFAAMRMRRISQGDRRAAAILPLIGRISGAVAVLTVIFAVLTFSQGIRF